MSEVTVTVRTADRTRRAEVTLAREQTGADLVRGAVENWALPKDAEYALVNASRGKLIHPECCLDPNLVGDGDELEIQPVLLAGRRP